MRCSVKTKRGFMCKNNASVDSFCTYHYNRMAREELLNNSRESDELLVADQQRLDYRASLLASSAAYSRGVSVSQKIIQAAKGICLMTTKKGVKCKLTEESPGCGYCWRHKAGNVGGQEIIHEHKPSNNIACKGICSMTTKKGVKCKLTEESTGCGYCWRHKPEEDEEGRVIEYIDYGKTCMANIIDNGILQRCNAKVQSESYCSDHAYQYRLDKPDNCPICMDIISSSYEIPLNCGHWFHAQCLRHWGKDNCSVCKKRMTEDEINRYYRATSIEFNEENYADIQYMVSSANDIINHLNLVQLVRSMERMLSASR